MGLRAVANPAAGGQPGSFTSLTATSLTVNGNSTLGLGDFSSTTTVNGTLTVTGGSVTAFNGGLVVGNNTGVTWNGNGGVGYTINASGGLLLTPEAGQNVQFGAYVAGAATDSTGYIEIKDAGGTIRKLMVQA